MEIPDHAKWCWSRSHFDILVQEIEDSRQGGFCGRKGGSLQGWPVSWVFRRPSSWKAEHQWLLSTWWWWGTSTSGKKAMVCCNISEFPYSQPVTVLIPRRMNGPMGWYLLKSCSGVDLKESSATAFARCSKPWKPTFQGTFACQNMWLLYMDLKFSGPIPLDVWILSMFLDQDKSFLPMKYTTRIVCVLWFPPSPPKSLNQSQSQSLDFRSQLRNVVPSWSRCCVEQRHGSDGDTGASWGYRVSSSLWIKTDHFPVGMDHLNYDFPWFFSCFFPWCATLPSDSTHLQVDSRVFPAWQRQAPGVFFAQEGRLERCQLLSGLIRRDPRISKHGIPRTELDDSCHSKLGMFPCFFFLMGAMYPNDCQSYPGLIPPIFCWSEWSEASMMFNSSMFGLVKKNTTSEKTCWIQYTTVVELFSLIPFFLVQRNGHPIPIGPRLQERLQRLLSNPPGWPSGPVAQWLFIGR